MAWNSQKMPLRLQDAQGCPGKEGGRCHPLFQLAKLRSCREEPGFLTTVMRAGVLGAEGGAAWISPPWVSRTLPGSNPSQVLGLEALPRKQAQLAPDPASRHHGPSPPPRLNRRKACDPGPGSQEFSLTPRHPTPGREPIGCARAFRARLVWLCASNPPGSPVAALPRPAG